MKNGPYELVVAPPEYPGKRYRDKYVYEHQLVWWQRTGQLVPKGYVIHHLNENKRDNSLSNLELKSSSDHMREHCEEKAKPVQLMCPQCGNAFVIPTHVYNTRTKYNKMGIFCSRSCGTRYQVSLGLVRGSKNTK